MTVQTPARVLLVDDHELVREALRSVLARESDLEVVGEARDGGEALELARSLRPDLVIMDVRMPTLDGLAAMRATLTALPSARVVLLTSYDNRAYVLDALRAGAAGYLLKGATKQEVLATLRAALAGKVHVQAEVAGHQQRMPARTIATRACLVQAVAGLADRYALTRVLSSAGFGMRISSTP